MGPRELEMGLGSLFSAVTLCPGEKWKSDFVQLINYSPSLQESKLGMKKMSSPTFVIIWRKAETLRSKIMSREES